MSETWQTHWVYPCSDVQDVVILYLSDTYNRYIIFLIIFTRVFDRQVRLYGRTRKAVEETLRIPDVHFDLIPLVNLVSNQDYHRDLSESHITKAIRDSTSARSTR